MSDPDKLWAPKIFGALGFLACSVLAYFAFCHLRYYLLPQTARPFAPQYDFLRSSGYAGLTFGAVGTVLIILNLSYLIRKEFARGHWMGNLRSWISLHIATGFVAYFLILLHADFLLRSALGSLALVGFTIVIVTGIIGRYIYAHTPRSLEGAELEIDEVRTRLK